ncbi:MAG: hypothetical protein LBO21_03035 [Synergistaceae bacterium]|nr:hypothetical protein [Synergistaceae bacterium]
MLRIRRPWRLYETAKDLKAPQELSALSGSTPLSNYILTGDAHLGIPRQQWYPVGESNP